MALEWVLLGYAAGAEAIMLLLLTMPRGFNPLRTGLISVIDSSLKPMLSLVSFCLFLLLDIFWKYETLLACEKKNCSQSEHLSHQKSIMKSQRNAILIAASLLQYWLLFSVTSILHRLDSLNQQLKNLKASK